MQLTKFGHSCVRFTDGARVLTVDPGSFSDTADALDGAQAVLITHEHPDHVDADSLAAALTRDSRLALFAPAVVAAQFERFGEQVTVAEPGQSFAAAGFAVQTFGGQHAVIHPSIPVVANIAYLIEGGVYHPGDSFTVPTVPVQTLLLPTIAPWSKAAEVIDFAISVRAPRTVQIHDFLATPQYAGLVEAHIRRLTEPLGVQFDHIDDGTPVDLVPAGS